MSNYPDDVDSSTVLPGEDCPELPDLKPCPFCGSEEVTLDWVPVEDNVFEFGYCHSCDAGGPHRDTELDAITAWNRRFV